jgi:hypothetical protein
VEGGGVAAGLGPTEPPLGAPPAAAGAGVAKVGGVTAVPATDSDSPTAVTPGLGAGGPTVAAGGAGYAGGADTAGVATAGPTGEAVTGALPLAGGVPDGVRMALVALDVWARAAAALDVAPANRTAAITRLMTPNMCPPATEGGPRGYGGPRKDSWRPG